MRDGSQTATRRRRTLSTTPAGLTGTFHTAQLAAMAGPRARLGLRASGSPGGSSSAGHLLSKVDW